MSISAGRKKKANSSFLGVSYVSGDCNGQPLLPIGKFYVLEDLKHFPKYH